MNRQNHLTNREPAHEGVITLADQHYFEGFVLLYESIQNAYPVPVTCFDGGLSSAQKQWAAKHLVNCNIAPIPQDADIDYVVDNLSSKPKNNRRESMLWICPFLVKNSPYRRVFWLDSDLIVLGNLKQLFTLLDAGPVFTPSNSDPQLVKNQPTLFTELPLRECASTNQPLINAGVSGWDCVRDQNIIKDYALPALMACSNKAVRESITWHDQGCLIWAIQNNCLHHRIQQSPEWNFCAIHTDKKDDFDLYSDLNYQLKSAYPDANIVHWNHAKLQDKLFKRLGSESEILSQVSQRLSKANR